MALVTWPDQRSTTTAIGNKARALAALQGQSGVTIPPWFAVLPGAVEAADDPNRARLRAEAASEVAAALSRLCPNGEMVAVRSSAADEDGTRHSYAGQLDSFLAVGPEDVAARVAEVVRSGFGPRVTTYRKQHRTGPPAAPAVLVQRMVAADAAGAAFSVDPVTGDDVVVVAAVYGLGSAVVSGEADSDTYRVGSDGSIVTREVVHKATAHKPSVRSGVELVAVPGVVRDAPVLDDDQARAIAALARRTAAFFGRPQDIEWAIEGDRLYLLQSRPVTVAGRDQGALNLWDNSNIAESYSGITSPLTFSFARQVYEDVYRQLCRVMRVPSGTIEDHRDDFRRMIGLIRGRVYYNLLSWYRLLATVPGFVANRKFMEQMMGVSEALPGELLSSLTDPRPWARFKDNVRMAGTVASLIGSHFALPRRIEHFNRQLDAVLGATHPDFGAHRADEVVAYYRQLERDLVGHWDVPLINDFLTMMFFGVLRRLSATWCSDEDGTLANDLLLGQDAPATGAVGHAAELARAASGHPGLIEALRTGSVTRAETAMQQVPEFHSRYRDYLERFGDRCFEELKLEAVTLRDDPLPLLASVGEMAGRLRDGSRVASAGAGQRDDRLSCGRRRMRKALRGRPVRYVVFWWVLRNTRARVRDREELRLGRTRVFGRVRHVFRDLGAKFHAADRLDDPGDVFFLELDEVLGFVEGTATSVDLRGLAALRKVEWERYREAPAPPDRFETYGAVHLASPVARDRAAAAGGAEVTGVGACSGVVRGSARVVTDPQRARLKAGEILVAEQTDPGWAVLFAAAGGVVTERGSLLSHSAIVAREMGIPTVVSAKGVTRWLRDGDWVEVDGGSGVVRKIEPPAAMAGSEAAVG